MDPINVYNLKYNTTCGKCNTEYTSDDYFVRGVGEEKPTCLVCAGLSDLTFLPPGDATLTRRSRKNSSLCAILFKYSTARKRYERVGILVEEQAIIKAKEECAQDESVREKNRKRDAERKKKIDDQYTKDFAHHIRKFYPSMPKDLEFEIAGHACGRSSGRVGRSSGAKTLQESYIHLAVAAHVRHAETSYDEYCHQYSDKKFARELVRDTIDDILCEWSSKIEDKS